MTLQAASNDDVGGDCCRRVDDGEGRSGRGVAAEGEGANDEAPPPTIPIVASAATESLVAATRRATRRPFLSTVLSAAFLLPLFLFLSTLALPPGAAWAVQSGGRMGGSFGGGGGGRQQSSSGRSYSGGGGGGYRGPTRSNTNVIISPGINPFYR